MSRFQTKDSLPLYGQALNLYFVYFAVDTVYFRDSGTAGCLLYLSAGISCAACAAAAVIPLLRI